MIDLFETIFIWGLYLILPSVLIIRLLGRYRAAFLFAGILALSQTDDVYSGSFGNESKSYTAMEQIRDSNKSGSFLNTGSLNLSSRVFDVPNGGGKDENLLNMTIKDLPKSPSGKYTISITTKKAEKALARALKNPETKKEILASLKKIEDGALLPRNTQDFKNFKGLREAKFKDIRMLFEPQKKNEPDKIVAIFDRKEMNAIKKALRPHYKKK